VAAHDLIVSLVPAFLHPPVARAALAARRPLVTASYVSPELAAMHDDAVRAGVCFLNEVGLDPGMDHVSAMHMIDGVKAAGGRPLSFTSVCGGLPAPEAASNPLGYKFSWSPRGALAASQNPAQWRSGGRVVGVPGAAMLLAAAPYRLHRNPAFALEVLPNRDSVPYAAKYGVPDIPNMFRGTLRYRGFATLLSSLSACGLLTTAPAPALGNGRTDGQDTWDGPSLRAYLAAGAGLGSDAAERVDDEALLEAVAARVAALRASSAGALAGAGLAPQSAALDVDERARLRECLVWLGWLGPESRRTHAPRTPGASTLDSTAVLLKSQPSMQFGPGERDLALMQHELVAEMADGRLERRVATLVEYGDARATAMARTVGLCTAVAAQLMLDGAGGARTPGVATPVTRDWYAPILAGLEAEGLGLRESAETVAAAGSPEAAKLKAQLLGAAAER
jgi:saccharopine dehydrogenase-like NADP-dependent oxidoreductase